MRYGLKEALAGLQRWLITALFPGARLFLRTKVPAPFNTILLRCNPVAFIINAYRNIFLHNKMPSLAMMGCWTLAGLLLTAIGIHIIHKYENSYAKVI